MGITDFLHWGLQWVSRICKRSKRRPSCKLRKRYNDMINPWLPYSLIHELWMLICGNLRVPGCAPDTGWCWVHRPGCMQCAGTGGYCPIESPAHTRSTGKKTAFFMTWGSIVINYRQVGYLHKMRRSDPEIHQNHPKTTLYNWDKKDQLGAQLLKTLEKTIRSIRAMKWISLPKLQKPKSLQ